MDMYGVFMLTLILLWVILFATGLISLEKRDNKKILENKWGLWGTIALVVAILGFLIALVFWWVIMLMFWGSDY